MDSSYTGEIILLIILIMLSGFFSMSETALMSLSKIRIRHMKEEGIKGAKLVDKLLEDPNKLLGAILIRMATHTRDFSHELVVRDSQHIKKSICRDRQETYPILLELLGTRKAN